MTKWERTFLLGIVILLAGCKNPSGSGGVDGGGGDTVPPVRSDGAPTQLLPSGTTETTVSLRTNEHAVCRFSTQRGVPFHQMNDTFMSNSETSHSTLVGGLADGAQYVYYVRCQDDVGNANEDDYEIAFMVAQPDQPICEAPAGHQCWYVSPTGNDSSDGSFERPFEHVQYALDVMSGGDIVYLREGVYREGHIRIDIDDDGTPEAWSTLKAYPGEWAVLDGENGGGDGGINGLRVGDTTNAGCVLGNRIFDSQGPFAMSYWKFERLEIRNGAHADGHHAAGFDGEIGPFWFRYCYIHDNVANNGGANPSGIKGHVWHNSIVEFSIFENNGMSEGTNGNCAHIALYSDYRWSETSENGFDPDRPSVHGNEIRYNLFLDAPIGFKHKGKQLFSGRNPAGNHGLEDTCSTYGDRIHHNIFRNIRGYAIGAHQDFAQVYNNIIDSCGSGIRINYEPGRSIYKAVTYNNLIVNVSIFGLVRFGTEYTDLPFESSAYFGWDYNNLFYGCGQVGGSYHWCPNERTLNVVPAGNSACGQLPYDLSNYYNSHNYFHSSADPYLFNIAGSSYTSSEFESQTVTAGSTVVYSNDDDPQNPLFQGGAGAEQFRIRGDHVLSGSTTASNGGSGGSHPYLPSVSLPGYVGATNPQNDDWVAGVLSLTDIGVLKNGGPGNPIWVE